MKTLLIFIGLSLSLLNNALASDAISTHGSLNAAFTSWGSASLQGDWAIVVVNGKKFIELSENFKAKEGPDVKIFLSPLHAEKITGGNATDNSVFVTQISSFEGRSRFEIPAGTNLNDFQSLVFHCEAYSKLWGTAALGNGQI